MNGQRSTAGDPARLDRALIALRRFWTAPDAVPDGAASVELSTLLVLEAVLAGPAAGDREIGVGLVGERLDVRPSTASRLVDRAAAAGVLAKRPSTLDGRSLSLTLTPAGEGLARRARQFRGARLDALLRDWSTGDRDQLTTLLERLAAAVHSEQPRA